MTQNRRILSHRFHPTTRPAALFLVGALSVGFVAAETSEAPAAEAPVGTFDVATVEDLALFYAEESYRRLRIPLLMRLVMIAHPGPGRKEAIADLHADPPKADSNGVVYPFGDSNPLSFAYDAKTRTLTCWERLAKKRGSMGFMGMTGPEHTAALNASSSRQRDRGGADWAWDPIRDAISLRRVYLHPPEDRERFYRDIDSLLRTQMKWAKKRYLRETIALAESRHPPASATATADGFTATLILRHFSAPAEESQFWVERYFRAWDRHPRFRAPLLVSDGELPRDRRMHFFVHFQGAENNENGVAPIEAVFRLTAPDGSTLFENFAATVWREKANEPDHLHIGVNNTFVQPEATRPGGGYLLEAEVCDATTGRCVNLTHPFELLDG